jgi:chorismate mutase
MGGKVRSAPGARAGGKDAAGGRRRAPSGPADPRRGAERDPFLARRLRIDAIDRQLVGLLNERATQAIALGGLKKERGLPIYQPSREEEVLKNVQAFNRGPLEDSALRRLFERIIDESRRIERIATTGAGRVGVEERSGSDPDPATD